MAGPLLAPTSSVAVGGGPSHRRLVAAPSTRLRRGISRRVDSLHHAPLAALDPFDESEGGAESGGGGAPGLDNRPLRGVNTRANTHGIASTPGMASTHAFTTGLGYVASHHPASLPGMVAAAAASPGLPLPLPPHPSVGRGSGRPASSDGMATRRAPSGSGMLGSTGSVSGMANTPLLAELLEPTSTSLSPVKLRELQRRPSAKPSRRSGGGGGGSAAAAGTDSGPADRMLFSSASLEAAVTQEALAALLTSMDGGLAPGSGSGRSISTSSIVRRRRPWPALCRDGETATATATGSTSLDPDHPAATRQESLGRRSSHSHHPHLLSRPWHTFPLEWAKVLDGWLPMWTPSPGRSAWDVLVLLLLLFTAVEVPLEAGFPNQMGHVAGLAATHVGVLVVFWVDIVVQFRTAYVSDAGELVRESGAVAANYARTWLAPDLLSSMPWGEILKLALGTHRPGVGVLASLLRLPRLLRLMRLLRQLDRVRYANVVRMGRLLVLVLMVSHWTACLWHGLAHWLDGWPWLFGMAGLRPADPLITQYSYSIYYSLVLVVGGDNLPANNNLERAFMIVMLVAGSILYALVVSNMAFLVANFNSLSSRYKSKAALAADALRYIGAPEEQRQRVAEYYDFLISNDHPGPEADGFINELPRGLVQDIKWALYAGAFHGLPLFGGCNEAFMAALQARLTLAAYTPGEVIYRALDVGRDMYIMRRAVVLQPTDVVVLAARDVVAVCKDHPDAGAIVQDRLYQRYSSVLAGGPTAYLFQDFLNAIGSYDDDELMYGNDVVEDWFQSGGQQLRLSDAQLAALSAAAAAQAEAAQGAEGAAGARKGQQHAAEAKEKAEAKKEEEGEEKVDGVVDGEEGMLDSEAALLAALEGESPKISPVTDSAAADLVRRGGSSVSSWASYLEAADGRGSGGGGTVRNGLGRGRVGSGTVGAAGAAGSPGGVGSGAGAGLGTSTVRSLGSGGGGGGGGGGGLRAPVVPKSRLLSLRRAKAAAGLLPEGGAPSTVLEGSVERVESEGTAEAAGAVVAAAAQAGRKAPSSSRSSLTPDLDPEATSPTARAPAALLHDSADLSRAGGSGVGGGSGSSVSAAAVLRKLTAGTASVGGDGSASNALGLADAGSHAAAAPAGGKDKSRTKVLPAPPVAPLPPAPPPLPPGAPKPPPSAAQASRAAAAAEARGGGTGAGGASSPTPPPSALTAHQRARQNGTSNGRAQNPYLLPTPGVAAATTATARERGARNGAAAAAATPPTGTAAAAAATVAAASGAEAPLSRSVQTPPPTAQGMLLDSAASSSIPGGAAAAVSSSPGGGATATGATAAASGGSIHVLRRLASSIIRRFNGSVSAAAERDDDDAAASSAAAGAAAGAAAADGAEVDAGLSDVRVMSNLPLADASPVATSNGSSAGGDGGRAPSSAAPSDRLTVGRGSGSGMVSTTPDWIVARASRQASRAQRASRGQWHAGGGADAGHAASTVPGGPVGAGAGAGSGTGAGAGAMAGGAPADVAHAMQTLALALGVGVEGSGGAVAATGINSAAAGAARGTTGGGILAAGPSATRAAAAMALELLLLQPGQKDLLLALADAVVRRFGADAVPSAREATREAAANGAAQVEARLGKSLRTVMGSLGVIEQLLSRLDAMAVTAKRRLAAIEHAAVEAAGDGVLAPNLLGVLDTESSDGLATALERLRGAAEPSAEDNNINNLPVPGARASAAVAAATVLTMLPPQPPLPPPTASSMGVAATAAAMVATACAAPPARQLVAGGPMPKVQSLQNLSTLAGEEVSGHGATAYAARTSGCGGMSGSGAAAAAAALPAPASGSGMPTFSSLGHVGFLPSASRSHRNLQSSVPSEATLSAANASGGGGAGRGATADALAGMLPRVSEHAMAAAAAASPPGSENGSPRASYSTAAVRRQSVGQVQALLLMSASSTGGVEADSALLAARPASGRGSRRGSMELLLAAAVAAASEGGSHRGSGAGSGTESDGPRASRTGMGAAATTMAEAQVMGSTGGVGRRGPVSLGRSRSLLGRRSSAVQMSDAAVTSPDDVAAASQHAAAAAAAALAAVAEQGAYAVSMSDADAGAAAAAATAAVAAAVRTVDGELLDAQHRQARRPQRSFTAAAEAAGLRNSSSTADGTGLPGGRLTFGGGGLVSTALRTAVLNDNITGLGGKGSGGGATAGGGAAHGGGFRPSALLPSQRPGARRAPLKLGSGAAMSGGGGGGGGAGESSSYFAHSGHGSTDGGGVEESGVSVTGGGGRRAAPFRRASTSTTLQVASRAASMSAAAQGGLPTINTATAAAAAMAAAAAGAGPTHRRSQPQVESLGLDVLELRQPSRTAAARKARRGEAAAAAAAAALAAEIDAEIDAEW
eukprot:XP_001699828.1 predicted protein [Chlamydomonas reinhardtii]